MTTQEEFSRVGRRGQMIGEFISGVGPVGALGPAGGVCAYYAEADVLLHGHSSCCCVRGKTPERLKYVLVHNQIHHGPWPKITTDQRQEYMVTGLRQEAAKSGWVVHMSGISYGTLRSGDVDVDVLLRLALG